MQGFKKLSVLAVLTFFMGLHRRKYKTISNIPDVPYYIDILAHAIELTYVIHQIVDSLDATAHELRLSSH